MAAIRCHEGIAAMGRSYHLLAYWPSLPRRVLRPVQ